MLDNPICVLASSCRNSESGNSFVTEVGVTQSQSAEQSRIVREHNTGSGIINPLVSFLDHSSLNYTYSCKRLFTSKHSVRTAHSRHQKCSSHLQRSPTFAVVRSKRHILYNPGLAARRRRFHPRVSYPSNPNNPIRDRARLYLITYKEGFLLQHIPYRPLDSYWRLNHPYVLIHSLALILVHLLLHIILVV